MRNPTADILMEHAPLSAWKAAEKQALRSTYKLFKTGAVLLDKRGNVVSKGCSHPRHGHPPRPSMHAEQHALSGILNPTGMTCLIVTINKSGNYACSSKPCAFCTHILNKAGIERVIYAERTNDGEWSVNNETVSSLTSRLDPDMIHETYTKQMRIA
jgi:deoxycytidylate deaminase